MKKTHKIIIVLSIILISMIAFGVYAINYKGGTIYFYMVSGKHGSGYFEAIKFKELSTQELIKIIDKNKNFNKYPHEHVMSYFMAGRLEGAIDVLGSRTDENAIAELTDIISNYKEGQKWTAIYSIGRNKNKSMVPVLCEALKKHTFWHTDILIVSALDEIDDSSALDYLIQEKDKIESGDSRRLAEKAIKRWQEMK